LAASPLILLNSLALAGLFILAALNSGMLGIGLLSQLALGAFLCLQIFFLLVRRLPERKSQEWWPRAVALTASNIAAALIFVPKVRLDGLGLTISALFLLVGSCSSIYVLLWLGRSFSILPQARGLVTGGPYRMVRHPLYAAEFITMFGAMLQFQPPWATAIFVATVASQLWRMKNEEEILLRTYPEYAGYMKHTAALIPGLY